MNHNHIVLGVMLALLLPLALLMGQWSATDPLLAVSVTIGAILLATVVTLERSIWLLIPLFFAFRFPFTALPGGFALRDVVAGLVCTFLFIIWGMKRFEIRLRFGIIEIALLAQFVCLGQAFLRNPVGLSVLGDETVGGRPYFEIGVSLFVFAMLSTQIVRVDKIKLAAKLLLLGGCAAAFVEVIGTLVPGVGLQILRFYQFGSASYLGRELGIREGYASASANAVGRREYLFHIVKPLFAYLLAVVRPIGLINIRRPMVVLGFAIVMAAVLLSGFRSLLVWVGMMYIAACLVQRKFVDLAIATGAGIVFLGVLVAGNGTLFNLPLSVQRTLSFLPGNWDSFAVQDATHSADWRYEMWETVLTTNIFIENHWLGDGYGFNADDLAFFARASVEPMTPEMQQEHFMRSGEYHSGPIQTVNRVGYLGLLVLMIGMIIFARFAYVMIRRAEGTDYYVAAMYIGLPMIIYPVFFCVVIGGYQEALVMMTFNGGMLRMMQNSMERYPIKEKAPERIEEPAGEYAY